MGRSRAASPLLLTTSVLCQQHAVLFRNMISCLKLYFVQSRMSCQWLVSVSLYACGNIQNSFTFIGVPKTSLVWMRSLYDIWSSWDSHLYLVYVWSLLPSLLSYLVSLIQSRHGAIKNKRCVLSSIIDCTGHNVFIVIATTLYLWMIRIEWEGRRE